MTLTGKESEFRNNIKHSETATDDEKERERERERVRVKKKGEKYASKLSRGKSCQ